MAHNWKYESEERQEGEREEDEIKFACGALNIL